MKKVYVFILSMVLLPQASQSSVGRNESIYIGSVGQSLIAFDLAFIHDDGKVSATYFYRTFGKDILLSGSQRGNNLTLTETFLDKKYNEVKKGTFKLIKIQDRLTGVWAFKNQELPVSLRLARPDDLTSPFNTPEIRHMKMKAPYEYLRLNEPLQLKIRQRRFQGGRVLWYQEPKSKTLYPYPGSGEDFPDIVDDQLSTSISLLRTCRGEQVSEDDYEAKPKFLTKKLFSYSTHYVGYCGAHPYIFWDSKSVNLKTGGVVLLEDLYEFAKLPTAAPRDVSKQVESSQYQIYELNRARVLWNLVRKTNVIEIDKECFGLYPQAFVGTPWFLTPQGLTLQPKMSHLDLTCAGEFLLPFSKIKQYRVANDLLN